MKTKKKINKIGKKKISKKISEKKVPKLKLKKENPIILNKKVLDNKLTPSVKEEISEIKRKILPPSDIKVSVSDSKILKLLDVSHLDELFYLISILEDKEINLFLEHYKKVSSIDSKDEKLDRLIKNSKNRFELLENIRKEIINKMNDEYLELRSKISTLRKKGEDIYIEDITSLNIPHKIRMFDATSKKEDYYKAKKMLENIGKEVELKYSNIKK